MRDYSYFVYLLASRRNGTLYCGVTNNLLRRVAEHREGRAESFTRRYGVTRLVWFETHSEIAEAILREKRIKGWNRAWKIAMIEAKNPAWRDLAEEMGLGPFPSVIPAKAGTQTANGALLHEDGSPLSRG
ncbi:MAG: GIY-YIG nuclease family protein [Pseudomonadota bacterium]